MFSIGYLMKLASIAGGEFIIGLSLSFLSMLYFAVSTLLFNSVSIRQLFKGGGFNGVSSLRIAGSAGTGIVFSIAITGIMFRELRLEGAGFMLALGTITSTLVLVVVLIKYLQSRKVPFYQNMLIRTLSINMVVILDMYL